MEYSIRCRICNDMVHAKKARFLPTAVSTHIFDEHQKETQSIKRRLAELQLLDKLRISIKKDLKEQYGFTITGTGT